MKILTLYSLFAVIATAVNIACQELTINIYQGVFYLFMSVLVGTLAGLIVKYVLDKKYIFKYQTKNAKHDGKTFILYAFMGVLTTVIFWGFEFGFHYLYETKEMRYLGGIIGLMIGYVTKYLLDKKYVFI